MAQAPLPGGTTDASSVAATTANDPISQAFGTIATNAPSTAATSVANTQPIFPNASLSPYYFLQTGTTYQVDMGGIVPGGGTMNIDQAVNLFDSLDPASLRYVEQRLEAAGFYTAPDGSPLKTAAVLGTLDDQGRRAWVNALIAAISSGQSVAQTIEQAIQSGQGAELKSTLPGAVLGGGNVYTVDLTSPGAVNQVANNIFQAALGRNATAAELANITNAVNQGTIAQGLAKEQGAEQSAQQQYQARVNQRNIAYQFETNPKVALGPVPSGNITTPVEYATSLLQYMGLPMNASNVAFLTGLINAMGGDMGGMNPLGSQNAVPGSQATKTATPSYSSWQQSLYATAGAFQGFNTIMQALQSGDASSFVNNPAMQAELGKWSDGQIKDISKQVNAAQKQAQQQVNVVGQQAQASTNTTGTQTQYQNMPGYEDFIKGGGTPAQWQAAMQQQQAGAAPQNIGTAQSTGAEGGGPGNQPTVPAATVATPGQQQTNPGDQYINPTTVFSQNPLSPEQASYLQATTGPNRFSFAENNYLHAFLAAVNMIKAGGPTGA